MKGIDVIGKNITEIAGEELGATKLWEQYSEVFTTIHYVSRIEIFDSYFGNLKFCQTNATLQIISCTKAILFVLTHENEINFFGFYRNQIKELTTEDNSLIQVRSINRLTKTLKSLKGIAPLVLGGIADKFVKIQERTVKGKIYKLVVIDENNQENEIIFTSQEEDNHTLATDEFVTRHLTSQLPSKANEGCYIATACYGSYYAPEVIVFRRYRDLILKRTFLGNILVKVYYLLSPSLTRHFFTNTKFNLFIKNKFLNKLHSRILLKYKF